MLVFEENWKPEYPEKNLSEQRREPTTNLTHIWYRVRESNPGHNGGRRVLSPLRHPCSPRSRDQQAPYKYGISIPEQSQMFNCFPCTILLCSLQTFHLNTASHLSPSQPTDSRRCSAKECRIAAGGLACVAVVSVSFKPSRASARGHLAKRSKKSRSRGEGRGRKGNACRWAQTFYRTSPNGFAPLGSTLSRQMSHENQSFLTSGKSERKQNRGGQLVYFKL